MYTKQVHDVHRLLAPLMRIDQFVAALKPSALNLEDRSQFYAPIAFGVQISGPIGGAAGAIRVEVPVHANPDGWLPLMKSRFARMVGMPELRADEMEFRTVTGAPLQSVPVDALPRVGKLNLFVHGELLRMPEVPAIPIEYSTNKMQDIARWITDRVEQAMPDLLASALQKHCHSASALETALLPDGPVQRAIEQCVVGDNASEWTEFVRTRHMHSPDALAPEEAMKSAKQIARDTLVHLRTLVQSAAPQIKEALGAQEAARLAADMRRKAGSGKGDAHLFASLLGSEASGSGSGSSIPQLMQTLAEETCTSPALQKAIATALHTRPLPIGACRWAPPQKESSSSSSKRKGNTGSDDNLKPSSSSGGSLSTIVYKKIDRQKPAEFDWMVAEREFTDVVRAAYIQFSSELSDVYKDLTESDAMQAIRNFVINARVIDLDVAFSLINANITLETGQLTNVCNLILATFGFPPVNIRIGNASTFAEFQKQLRALLLAQGVPTELIVFGITKPNNWASSEKIAPMPYSFTSYRYVRPREALVLALDHTKDWSRANAGIAKEITDALSRIQADEGKLDTALGLVNDKINRINSAHSLRFLGFHYFSCRLLASPGTAGEVDELKIGLYAVARNVCYGYAANPGLRQSPYYDTLAALRPLFIVLDASRVAREFVETLGKYLELGDPSDKRGMLAALEREPLKMQKHLIAKVKGARTLANMVEILLSGGKEAAIVQPWETATAAKAPVSKEEAKKSMMEWIRNQGYDLESADVLKKELEESIVNLSGEMESKFYSTMAAYAQNPESVPAAGPSATKNKDRYWDGVAQMIWRWFEQEEAEAEKKQGSVKLGVGLEDIINAQPDARAVKYVIHGLTRPTNKSEAMAAVRKIAGFKKGYVTTKLLNKKSWTWDDVKDIANALGVKTTAVDFPNTKTLRDKDSLENQLREAANAPLVQSQLSDAAAPTSVIEAHHPFNAQIHNTLQPLAGAYPAYYNVLHTKQDMSKDAPYAGDLLATYRKYCAFAGLPLVPAVIPKCPPTKPIASVIEAAAVPPVPATKPYVAAVPIECGSCKKMDEKRKKSSSSSSHRHHGYAQAQVGCHTTAGRNDPKYRYERDARDDEEGTVAFHRNDHYSTRKAQEEANDQIGCAPPRKGTQSKKPYTKVKGKLPEFGDIFK